MSQTEDPLDQMLRSWLERRPSLDDERLEELRDAILSGAATGEPVRCPSQPPRRTMTTMIWMAGGLAATVLVGAIAIWSFSRRESPLASGNSAAAARMAPRLVESEIVLEELTALFGDRLAWFGALDGRMQIGVLAEQDAPVEPGKFVVVRLEVVAQESERGPWQAVHSVEFVVREQSLVEVESPGRVSPVARLWTYRLPDGMVHVETDVELLHPLPLRISGTALQRLNSAVEIQEFQQGDVTYRVYQSAAAVTSDDLG